MNNIDSGDTGERIPREKLHDQNDQLSIKHIQTLQFVQEIARENKTLKATVEEYEKQRERCKEIHSLAEDSQQRLKDLQEQLQKRGDGIKAEMMKALEEKLDQERILTLEKAQLSEEVARLERTNKQLLLRLEGQTVSIQALQNRVENEQKLSKSYQDEIAELKREVDSLKHKTRQTVDYEEMDMMKARNNQLIQEVRESNQKNSELNFRVSKLEKALAQQDEDRDKVTLIENLRVKVTQMQSERGIALERERNYEKMLKELQAEMMALKESYVISQMDKNRIHTEYQKVLSELTYLRKQNSLESSSKSFKDFVLLKRELHEVKSENSGLKRMMKPTQLPMLKDSNTTQRLDERRGSGSSQTSKSSKSGGQKPNRIKSLTYLTS